MRVDTGKKLRHLLKDRFSEIKHSYSLNGPRTDAGTNPKLFGAKSTNISRAIRRFKARQLLLLIEIFFYHYRTVNGLSLSKV